jgi:hypothetical protein
MKIRFRYFICLSVLVFIPFALFSRPDAKYSISHEFKYQRSITGKAYTSVGDSPKIIKEKVVKTQAKPSEAAKEKIMPAWMWTAMGFLFGLFAGIFLIFLYSRLNIYSILATEKNKYLDRLKLDNNQNLLLRKCFKYIGIVALLKHSKDEKKRAIVNINKEISQVKKQNEQLKMEIGQKEKVITAYKINADSLTSAAEHSDRQAGKSNGISDKKREIFFTIPEGDGSFRNSNAKDWQDIDCFYKILPDKSGQKGKLYFIPGDYDLRALDNIDYYLNPVCEIQNITDRTFARKILMTDPGIVIKRGEYWQIEDNCKVKIKLV